MPKVAKNKYYRWGIVLLVAFVPESVLSAGYIPVNPNDVLWTLPNQARAEPLSDRLQQARDDAPAAARMAADLIRQGRRQGDARAFGQAEALLRPWLARDAVDTTLRLLWADILQHRHEFTAALAYIDAVLEREPNHAQALLMRVAIRVGQGDRNAAAQDCRRLLTQVEAVIVMACAGQTATDKARLAGLINSLSRMLPEASGLDVETQAWAWQVLAELHARVDDTAGAEHAFRRALQLTPAARPLLLALADWMLEHGRAAEIDALLRGHEENDAVLLRLALAQPLKSTLNPYHPILSARYRQALERGDMPPSLDYARYLLDLNHDADSALGVALKNWDLQKEPDAARFVIRAAAAAQQSGTAQGACAWLNENGFDAPGACLARVGMQAMKRRD